MGKWWSVTLIIGLIALSPAFALTTETKQEIKDKIESVITYAKQYEDGEINYLTFVAYSNLVDEQVRKILNKESFKLFEEGDERNEWESGLTKETIMEFFGTPTRMESWVWVRNEEQSMSLDERVPMWEKAIFTGDKIKVTFNAWPQVIKKYDVKKCPELKTATKKELKGGNKGYKCDYFTLLHFYEVGISTKFITVTNVDIPSLISDLNETFFDYYLTGEGIDELKLKYKDYSEQVRKYIDENRGIGDCKEFMKEAIGENSQTRLMSILQLEVPIYSENDGKISFLVRSCEDCDWKWINGDFRWEMMMPNFEFDGDREDFKPEYYAEESKTEIRNLIISKLTELKQDTNSKKGKISGDNNFFEKLFEYQEQIRAMWEVLNRLNNDIRDASTEEDRKVLANQNWEESIEWVETSLAALGEVTKDKSTSFEIENRILNIGISHKNNWCSEEKEVYCGERQMCSTASGTPVCLDSKGGNEICDNEVDDDSDNLIDCVDPDCDTNENCLCFEIWDNNELHPRCTNTNTECKIISLTSEVTAADIKDVYVSQDGSYLYIMFSVYDGTPDLKRTMYSADINTGRNNNWQNVHVEYRMREDQGSFVEEKRAWKNSPSSNSEVDSALIKVAAGSVIEFGIPLGVLGELINLNINVRTTNTAGNEWINYDDINKNIKSVSSASISVDGSSSDWTSSPVVTDPQGDGRGKEGQCRCASGFSDCDGDWQNGCETQSACCGSNTALNAEGYCNCAVGYMDCDFEWRNGCEKQGCCWPNTVVYNSENGNCKCTTGYYDCNGDWMSDGCESTELCSGAYQINTCGSNQVYAEGRCVCMQGYYDCDGKVNNGCESNNCGGVDMCAGVTCGPNSACVSETGLCGCMTDYYDCNGKGVGNDEDGCESKEDCSRSCTNIFCGENSYCNQNTLSCMCSTGYYECDGDLNNGCESTSETCQSVACGNVEICDDGEDNDCDGFIDSEDKDCFVETIQSEFLIVTTSYFKPELLTMKTYFKPMVSEQTSKECGWVEGGELEGCAENEYCDIVLNVRDGGSSITDGEASGKCVTQCESDSDCPSNMRCEQWDWLGKGVCRCKVDWDRRTYGYFDCDNNFENGCESQDSTCSGTYPACNQDCTASGRVCNTIIGECVCNEGSYDCDGDWQNGCESNQRCDENACETDEDCAEPRCSDWGGSVKQFRCMKGDTWFEEKEVFTLNGACEYKPNGEIEMWANFNSWGEKFGILNLNVGDDRSWCERELESLKMERLEIQNSLTNDYLTWYLDDLVANSPEDWQRLIGGIWRIYGLLTENTQRTAQNLECLGIDEWPEEYELITAEYSGNFGSIKLWEESKTAKVLGPDSKPRTVFSPYMSAWIFPSKELFKEEFVKGVTSGTEGPKGPTPRDVEEMKSDETVMGVIRSVAGAFGGEMKAILRIFDGSETLARIMMTVNEEEVIKIEILNETDTVQGTSFTIDIGYDFMYNMISAQEKSLKALETQMPPWEQKNFDMKNEFDKAGVGFNIFFQIVNAAISGQVSITPWTAGFTLLGVMTQFMQLFAQGLSQ